MKRPLAILATTAVTALAVVLPVRAAHAEESGIDVTDVSATWRDGTLSVSYDWDNWEGNSILDVLVDGVSVQHTDAGWLDSDNVSVKVARAAAAGPAKVAITAHICTYDTDSSNFTSTNCSDVTEWSTIVVQLKTPPKGKSSATALLDKLKVKGESHAGSYKRSKFDLWFDANGDHEDTRAEVLKAESKRKATLNSRHTVKTGRWMSPYDGKTVTVASKLDIDHMVPLAEAWASGAFSWSAKKRTAYANDLGYGASLVAVTKHANRSKGDRQPDEYLPTTRNYRCAYVRNWIAVKSRWALAVDSVEKSALSASLGTYCTSNDWVTTPGKPVIAKLVPKPKPKPAPKPVSGGGGGSASAYYANCDAVRAAGAAPLYRGDPGYETPRLDRDGDGVACE